MSRGRNDKNEQAYDKIVRLLDDLSEDDVTRLLALLSLRRKSGKNSGGAAPLSPDELLLYSAIVDTLRAAHKREIPPDEGKRTVPRMQGFDYAEFRLAYTVVQQYMNEYLSNTTRATTTRRKVYGVFCKAVYRYESNNKWAEGVRKRVEPLLNNNDISSRDLQRLHSVLNSYRPVGVASMIAGLQTISDAMEAAFPGYAQAGILGMLLQRGKQNDQ